jgi:hypothetical protein
MAFLTTSDWNVESVQNENDSSISSVDRKKFRRQRQSMNLGVKQTLIKRRKGSNISLFSGDLNIHQDVDINDRGYNNYIPHTEGPMITDINMNLPSPLTVGQSNTAEAPGVTSAIMSPSDKSFLRTIMYSYNNLTNMFEKVAEPNNSVENTAISVSKIPTSRIMEISTFLQHNDTERRNYYNNVKGNISVYFEERKNGLMLLQKKIQKSR